MESALLPQSLLSESMLQVQRWTSVLLFPASVALRPPLHPPPSLTPTADLAVQSFPLLTAAGLQVNHDNSSGLPQPHPEPSAQAFTPRACSAELKHFCQRLHRNPEEQCSRVSLHEPVGLSSYVTPMPTWRDVERERAYLKAHLDPGVHTAWAGRGFFFLFLLFTSTCPSSTVDRGLLQNVKMVQIS